MTKACRSAVLESRHHGAEILEGTDLWVADGRIAALLPAGSAPPVETLASRMAWSSLAS